MSTASVEFLLWHAALCRNGSGSSGSSGSTATIIVVCGRKRRRRKAPLLLLCFGHGVDFGWRLMLSPPLVVYIIASWMLLLEARQNECKAYVRLLTDTPRAKLPPWLLERFRYSEVCNVPYSAAQWVLA